MNARDVAYGYAIGYNDGLGSGSGGGETADEWQPPADWLTVPEPGPLEICMLVWTDSFGVTLYDHDTGNGGYGDCKVSVDWGDGTFGDPSDISGNNPRHKYAEMKQYVVKVTGAANANTFCYNNGVNGLQICKCGSGIYMWLNGEYSTSSPYNVFGNQKALKYVSIKNENGLWNADAYPNFYYGCFQNCNSLRRVDLPHKIKKFIKNEFNSCYSLSGIDLSEVTNIGDYTFYYNRVLKKAIMPECISIGQSAFSGCTGLEEVYAPKCTTVGNNAFEQCCNLQKVTFANGCTFGNNAFSNCYSLYPNLT